MRALKQLGTAQRTLPPGIYRRGDVYWIRAAHRGRRVRRPGGRTLGEALAAYEKLQAELADSAASPDGPTINSVADAYLEHLKLHAKPSSTASARSALVRVRAELGDMPAAALTAQQVDSYMTKRLTLVGKASVNRELRCLRAAVRLAVERKQLAAMPMKFKTLRVPRKPPAILTPAQVRALLDAAGDLRLLLAVAAYTGLRSGELCALRRRDVDLAAGVIRVSARDGWAPKSYRDREVPIHRVLREALSIIDQGDPDDRLFSSPRGCAWDPTSLSKAVRRVFARAGLYNPENKPGLHMLRRTFVSTILHGGTDVETARELAGHSSIAVTGLYAATTTAIKRKAVETLGF